MRSRALWLLSVPLLLVAVTEVTPAVLKSAVFVPREVRHASTPLRTVNGIASDLHCGALCLRTTDCLKWIRDPTSGECRLLPLHSASNPLTSEPSTVRQPPHPAGYIPMPGGGGVTYRPHSRLTPGGPVLIQLCREDDPQALPAFITNDAQFNFLLQMKFSYEWLWVSINDFEEEGVYKDLFNNKVVNIDNWISPTDGSFHSEALDGVLFSEGKGLKNRLATTLYSYLCEYWM